MAKDKATRCAGLLVVEELVKQDLFEVVDPLEGPQHKSIRRSKKEKPRDCATRMVRPTVFGEMVACYVAARRAKCPACGGNALAVNEDTADIDCGRCGRSFESKRIAALTSELGEVAQ